MDSPHYIQPGHAQQAQETSPGDVSPKRNRVLYNRHVAAGVAIGLVGVVIVIGLYVNDQRQRSGRVPCAEHLRMIGQGIAIYAHEHNGEYPARLDQLMTDADINPEVLVCPSSNDTAASGPTTQQIVVDFAKPGHCSYVYLGAGMNEKSVTPETVIAYENLADHGDGMNILFGDGHVDWYAKQEAAYVLSEIKAGHNPPQPATQPIR